MKTFSDKQLSEKAKHSFNIFVVISLFKVSWKNVGFAPGQL